MLQLQPDIRPLDCVRSKPEVIAAIVSACQQGQAEAENRLTPNRTVNYRGTEASLETLEALCCGLTPLGYQRQEVLNQIRLLSPPDQNGERHRFLACRGEAIGSNVTVNRKGYLTHQLVMQDNWHYVPHLAFSPVEESPPKNIWIIHQYKPVPGSDKILIVTLALPYPLVSGGTIFQCQDTETIHSAPLVQPLPVLENVPEGVQIDVIIDDNTGTDD